MNIGTLSVTITGDAKLLEQTANRVRQLVSQMNADLGQISTAATSASKAIGTVGTAFDAMAKQATVTTNLLSAAAERLEAVNNRAARVGRTARDTAKSTTDMGKGFETGAKAAEVFMWKVENGQRALVSLSSQVKGLTVDIGRFSKVGGNALVLQPAASWGDFQTKNYAAIKSYFGQVEGLKKIAGQLWTTMDAQQKAAAAAQASTTGAGGAAATAAGQYNNLTGAVGANTTAMANNTTAAQNNVASVGRATQAKLRLAQAAQNATNNTVNFSRGVVGAANAALHGTRSFTSFVASVAVGMLTFRAILGVFNLITGSIRGTIMAAVDFEASMASLKKIVQASEPEYETMAKQFRELARVIPIPVNELVKMGIAAGQLGIPKDQIVDFTRVMGMLAEVSDSLKADEAALQLAKFANVTGMLNSENIKNFKKDFEDLGNAIFSLSRAFPALDRDIIHLGTQIAQVGTNIGLSREEIMAWATAITSTGMRVESGGTAITRLFSDMYKAVDLGGRALDNFVATADMTKDAFRNLFKESPSEALYQFIAGLKTVEDRGGDVLAQLDILGLGNRRTRDTIMGLVASLEQLREALDLVGEKSKEERSLQEAYAKRLATTKAQMQLLGNEVYDLAITMGGWVIGPLHAAVRGINDFIKAVREANPVIKTFGLTLAFAFASVGIQKLTKEIGILLTASALLSRFPTVVVNNLGGVKGFLFDFVTLLRTMPALITRNAIGLLALGNAASNLGVRMGALGRFFQLAFKVMSGPTGWILSIGAAFTVLYHESESFKNRFLTSWESIKNSLSSIVKSMVDAIAAIFQIDPVEFMKGVKLGWSETWKAMGDIVVRFAKLAVGSIAGAVEAIAGLINIVITATTLMVNRRLSGGAVFQKDIDAFTKAIDQFRTGMAKIQMESLRLTMPKAMLDQLEAAERAALGIADSTDKAAKKQTDFANTVKNANIQLTKMNEEEREWFSELYDTLRPAEQLAERMQRLFERNVPQEWILGGWSTSMMEAAEDQMNRGQQLSQGAMEWWQKSLEFSAKNLSESIKSWMEDLRDLKIPESWKQDILQWEKDLKEQILLPEPWSEWDESRFQDWYRRVAELASLAPDPDAWRQAYDYRAAYQSGVQLDESLHWPSEFKKWYHPNRFVPTPEAPQVMWGTDTMTGQLVPPEVEMSVKEAAAQYREMKESQEELLRLVQEQVKYVQEIIALSDEELFKLAPTKAARAALNDQLREYLKFIEQALEKESAWYRMRKSMESPFEKGFLEDMEAITRQEQDALLEYINISEQIGRISTHNALERLRFEEELANTVIPLNDDERRLMEEQRVHAQFMIRGKEVELRYTQEMADIRRRITEAERIPGGHPLRAKLIEEARAIPETMKQALKEVAELEMATMVAVHRAQYLEMVATVKQGAGEFFDYITRGGKSAFGNLLDWLKDFFFNKLRILFQNVMASIFMPNQSQNIWEQFTQNLLPNALKRVPPVETGALVRVHDNEAILNREQTAFFQKGLKKLVSLETEVQRVETVKVLKTPAAETGGLIRVHDNEVILNKDQTSYFTRWLHYLSSGTRPETAAAATITLVVRTPAGAVASRDGWLLETLGLVPSQEQIQSTRSLASALMKDYRGLVTRGLQPPVEQYWPDVSYVNAEASKVPYIESPISKRLFLDPVWKEILDILRLIHKKNFPSWDTESVPDAIRSWKMYPGEWLPPTWKGAQATRINVPTGQYSSSYFGLYYPDKRMMDLNRFAGIFQQGATAIHEFAHAAWFEDLDEYDRQRWERLHNAFLQLGRQQTPPPSISFRRENPVESFAYSFENYVSSGSQVQQRFPELYNFFYKLTGGREYGNITKFGMESRVEERPTPRPPIVFTGPGADLLNLIPQSQQFLQRMEEVGEKTKVGFEKAWHILTTPPPGVQEASIASGITKAAENFYSVLRNVVEKKLPEVLKYIEGGTVPERIVPGRSIYHPKTGELIKQIPERVIPAQNLPGVWPFDQFMAAIKGEKGVTQDEINNTKILELLRSQSTVLREDLLRQIDANTPKFRDVLLEGNRVGYPGPSHNLPGGSNYKELFVTLEQVDSSLSQSRINQLERRKNRLQAVLDRLWETVGFGGPEGFGNDPLVNRITALQNRIDNQLSVNTTWADGHRGYQNIRNPIVRIRFDERYYSRNTIPSTFFTAPDEPQPLLDRSIKEMFIQEMQPPRESAQANMPPWVLKRWREIGMARAIQYAAENGFDRLSWTSGQMQKERNRLSRVVETLKFSRSMLPAEGAPPTYNVEAYPHGSRYPYPTYVMPNLLTESELAAYVGKEVARQVASIADAAGVGVQNTLRRQALDIGGVGLARLYEADMPIITKRLVGAVTERHPMEAVSGGPTGRLLYNEIEKLRRKYENQYIQALEEDWARLTPEWKKVYESGLDKMAPPLQARQNYRMAELFQKIMNAATDQRGRDIIVNEAEFNIDKAIQYLWSTSRGSRRFSWTIQGKVKRELDALKNLPGETREIGSVPSIDINPIREQAGKGFPFYSGMPLLIPALGDLDKTVKDTSKDFIDLDEILKKAGEQSFWDRFLWGPSNVVKSGFTQILDSVARDVGRASKWALDRLPDLRRIPREIWPEMSAENTRFEVQVGKWLTGEVQTMPRPEYLFRGVGFGSVPIAPTAPLTHATPWFDIATRAGDNPEIYRPIQVYGTPILRHENPLFYRGGFLNEAEFAEQTRIHSWRGMPWDEILKKGKQLFQRDYERFEGSYGPILGGVRYQDAVGLLNGVFEDIKNASYELDLLRRPGVLRARTPHRSEIMFHEQAAREQFGERSSYFPRFVQLHSKIRELPAVEQDLAWEGYKQWKIGGYVGTEQTRRWIKETLVDNFDNTNRLLQELIQVALGPESTYYNKALYQRILQLPSEQRQLAEKGFEALKLGNYVVAPEYARGEKVFYPPMDDIIRHYSESQLGILRNLDTLVGELITWGKKRVSGELPAAFIGTGLGATLLTGEASAKTQVSTPGSAVPAVPQVPLRAPLAFGGFPGADLLNLVPQSQQFLQFMDTFGETLKKAWDILNNTAPGVSEANIGKGLVKAAENFYSVLRNVVEKKLPEVINAFQEGGKYIPERVVPGRDIFHPVTGELIKRTSQRIIPAIVPKRITPLDQFMAAIEGEAVSLDELAVTNIVDRLKGLQSITKKEILDAIDARTPVLKDVWLTTPTFDDYLRNVRGLTGDQLKSAGWNRQIQQEFIAYKEEVGPKYGYENLVLPGGSNYRELLVTYTKKGTEHLVEGLQRLRKELLSFQGIEKEKAAEVARLKVEIERIENEMGAAWIDEHEGYETIINPIVRLRLEDRQSTQGLTGLFIEEMQPVGTKQQERMPAEMAKRWREIGMSRALKEAAEGGYDFLAWTSGQIQKERNAITRLIIEELRFSQAPTLAGQSQLYQVSALKARTREVIDEKYLPSVMTQDQLAKYVGKDVAERVAAMATAADQSLTGQALDISGVGLVRLYDTDYANIAKKLVKASTERQTMHVGPYQAGTLKKELERLAELYQSANLPVQREGGEFFQEILKFVATIEGPVAFRSNFTTAKVSALAHEISEYGTYAGKQFSEGALRIVDEEIKRLVNSTATETFPAVIMTPAVRRRAKEGFSVYAGLPFMAVPALTGGSEQQPRPPFAFGGFPGADLLNRIPQSQGFIKALEDFGEKAQDGLKKFWDILTYETPEVEKADIVSGFAKVADDITRQIPKLKKISLNLWDNLLMEEIEYRTELKNWLRSLGRVQPPAPPAFGYRSVSEGLGPARPEARYVHFSPWFSVAYSGGYKPGDEAHALWSRPDIYQMPFDWERTRLYRGGGLAEAPVESTTIHNVHGMNWNTVLQKALRLVQRDSNRAYWPYVQMYDRQIQSRLGLGGSEVTFPAIIRDIENATYEYDLINRPGIWAGRYIPSSLNATKPKKPGIGELTRRIDAQRALGYEERNIPEISALGYSPWPRWLDVSLADIRNQYRSQPRLSPEGLIGRGWDRLSELGLVTPPQFEHLHQMVVRLNQGDRSAKLRLDVLEGLQRLGTPIDEMELYRRAAIPLTVASGTSFVPIEPSKPSVSTSTKPSEPIPVRLPLIFGGFPGADLLNLVPQSQRFLGFVEDAGEKIGSAVSTAWEILNADVASSAVQARFDPVQFRKIAEIWRYVGDVIGDSGFIDKFGRFLRFRNQTYTTHPEFLHKVSDQWKVTSGRESYRGFPSEFINAMVEEHLMRIRSSGLGRNSELEVSINREPTRDQFEFLRDLYRGFNEGPEGGRPLLYYELYDELVQPRREAHSMWGASWRDMETAFENLWGPTEQFKYATGNAEEFYGISRKPPRLRKAVMAPFATAGLMVKEDEQDALLERQHELLARMLNEPWIGRMRREWTGERLSPQLESIRSEGTAAQLRVAAMWEGIEREEVGRSEEWGKTLTGPRPGYVPTPLGRVKSTEEQWMEWFQPWGDWEQKLGARSLMLPVKSLFAAGTLTQNLLNKIFNPSLGRPGNELYAPGAVPGAGAINDVMNWLFAEGANVLNLKEGRPVPQAGGGADLYMEFGGPLAFTRLPWIGGGLPGLFRGGWPIFARKFGQNWNKLKAGLSARAAGVSFFGELGLDNLLFGGSQVAATTEKPTIQRADLLGLGTTRMGQNALTLPMEAALESLNKAFHPTPLKLSPAVQNILKIADEYSKKEKWDPLVLQALIMQESSGNPLAKGDIDPLTGKPHSRGLLQLHDLWRGKGVSDKDAFDIRKNIELSLGDIRRGYNLATKEGLEGAARAARVADIAQNPQDWTLGRYYRWYEQLRTGTNLPVERFVTPPTAIQVPTATAGLPRIFQAIPSAPAVEFNVPQPTFRSRPVPYRPPVVASLEEAVNYEIPAGWLNNVLADARDKLRDEDIEWVTLPMPRTLVGLEQAAAKTTRAFEKVAEDVTDEVGRITSSDTGVGAAWEKILDYSNEFTKWGEALPLRDTRIAIDDIQNFADALAEVKESPIQKLISASRAPVLSMVPTGREWLDLGLDTEIKTYPLHEFAAASFSPRIAWSIDEIMAPLAEKVGAGWKGDITRAFREGTHIFTLGFGEEADKWFAAGAFGVFGRPAEEQGGFTVGGVADKWLETTRRIDLFGKTAEKSSYEFQRFMDAAVMPLYQQGQLNWQIAEQMTPAMQAIYNTSGSGGYVPIGAGSSYIGGRFAPVGNNGQYMWIPASSGTMAGAVSQYGQLYPYEGSQAVRPFDKITGYAGRLAPAMMMSFGMMGMGSQNFTGRLFSGASLGLMGGLGAVTGGIIPGLGAPNISTAFSNLFKNPSQYFGSPYFSGILGAGIGSAFGNTGVGRGIGAVAGGLGGMALSGMLSGLFSSTAASSPAIFGATGFTGATGGLSGMLGGLGHAFGLGGSSGFLGMGAATIPIIGAAIVAGLLGYKFSRGKNAYQAGAMEVSRDFGGLQYGKTDFQTFLGGLGISEKTAYPIRKDILSSPKFLAEVAGPLAKAQGLYEPFLRSLEKVQTSFGTFNFRAAFELGDATGDWSKLNQLFVDAFQNSKALQEALPNWPELLAATGQAGTTLLQKQIDALKAFRDAINGLIPGMDAMYTKFLETGEITDALRQQFTDLGGEISDLEELGGLIKTEKRFDELVQDFWNTGKVSQELIDIFTEFGFAADYLNEALELKNLKDTLDFITGLKSAIEGTIDSLDPLKQFMEGKWNVDIENAFEKAGLDPAKFQKLTPFFKIMNYQPGGAASNAWPGWKSMTDEFFTGTKPYWNEKQNKWGTRPIGLTSTAREALLQWGGAEGIKAVSNWDRGINTITPSLFDKTWLAMYEDYEKKGTDLLTDLKDAEDATNKAIRDLSEALGKKLDAVRDAIIGEKGSLAALITPVIDKMIIALDKTSGLTETETGAGYTEPGKGYEYDYNSPPEEGMELPPGYADWAAYYQDNPEISPPRRKGGTVRKVAMTRTTDEEESYVGALAGAGAGAGGSTVVINNGTFYGWDDFVEQVRRAGVNLKRRGK